MPLLASAAQYGNGPSGGAAILMAVGALGRLDGCVADDALGPDQVQRQQQVVELPNHIQ